MPIERDASFKGSDYRANFKQIVAKRPDLLQQDGGRVLKAGLGLVLVYQAGQVLGYASTGADAGFYKAYNDANTDGSQVAVGVLAEPVEVDDQGNGSEAVIIKSGTLFQAMLIGLDAAAIVDLKALSSLEHGVQLLRF